MAPPTVGVQPSYQRWGWESCFVLIVMFVCPSMYFMVCVLDPPPPEEILKSQEVMSQQCPAHWAVSHEHPAETQSDLAELG